MADDENKQVVRRFYEELWNRGNLDAADELVAPDYVRHDLRPGDAPPGPAGQKAVAEKFRAAFPDVILEVEALVAEGDLVVAGGRCSAPTQVRGATAHRRVEACASPVSTSSVSRITRSPRSGMSATILVYESSLAQRYTPGSLSRQTPEPTSSGRSQVDRGVTDRLGAGFCFRVEAITRGPTRRRVLAPALGVKPSARWGGSSGTAGGPWAKTVSPTVSRTAEISGELSALAGTAAAPSDIKIHG